MISNTELEEQLRATNKVDYVKVTGDGYHYQLVIVTDEFLGKSKVVRQQWVYRQLQEHIVAGRLHALSMQTWTKNEWETQHG